MNEETQHQESGAMLGKRARKRQDTSRRILDTAMKILVADGHDAFTIARLAGEMGYAVGALYRYYRGKDAIIAALQRRVVEQLDADIVTALEAAERDRMVPPRAHALYRFFVAVDVYATLTVRRSTDFHVLALSLGDPRAFMPKDIVDARLVPAYQSLLERFGNELDACVQAGALSAGNRRRRIVAIWGSTQGVMSLRKLARFDADLADPAVAGEIHRGLAQAWGGDAAIVDASYVKAIRLVAELDLTQPDVALGSKV